MASAINGVSLSESGNTGSPETFTAVISDTNGVLSATGGTQSNGNHTETITGSLAAVNADLATLSDTDSTAGADTITLNATDSFGNAATAQTIAVNATSGLAITVPGAQVEGVGKALGIPGISLSEAGSTGSETFTAVVSDTNGVLSATGGTQSNGNHTSDDHRIARHGECRSGDTKLIPIARLAASTITVNASDSLGSTATQQTIGVTVNGAPTIAVPGAQVEGVGKAHLRSVASRCPRPATLLRRPSRRPWSATPTGC